MKRLLEFLQEKNGNLSSTRLIVLIGFIFTMILTSNWVGSHPEATAAEIITLFAGLSGVFVTLKIGQKPMEKDK